MPIKSNWTLGPSHGGKLLSGGTTEPQVVKAYSLLQAILNTAVREEAEPVLEPRARPLQHVGAVVLVLVAQMLARCVALITAAASRARTAHLAEFTGAGP